jgi:methyl-accepting chemotaxis protein
VMAESGAEIPDTPYIRFTTAMAAEVAAQIEAHIAAGRVTLDQVLSEQYRPIVGSSPQKYDHPIVPFIVPAVRPHQEAARALPGFFGLTATDRNAFAAVAMPERSQPERAETAWNEEYSRHQQIYAYADTIAQAKTTQPFLIKAYRRTVATGGVMLLKQVIASIHVHGRHWGIVQLAYKDQG